MLGVIGGSQSLCCWSQSLCWELGGGARVYAAWARVYDSLVILVSAQVLLVLTLVLWTLDLGLTKYPFVLLYRHLSYLSWEKSMRFYLLFSLLACIIALALVFKLWLDNLKLGYTQDDSLINFAIWYVSMQIYNTIVKRRSRSRSGEGQEGQSQAKSSSEN